MSDEGAQKFELPEGLPAFLKAAAGVEEILAKLTRLAVDLRAVESAEARRDLLVKIAQWADNERCSGAGESPELQTASQLVAAHAWLSRKTVEVAHLREVCGMALCRARRAQDAALRADYLAEAEALADVVIAAENRIDDEALLSRESYRAWLASRGVNAPAHDDAYIEALCAWKAGFAAVASERPREGVSPVGGMTNK